MTLGPVSVDVQRVRSVSRGALRVGLVGSLFTIATGILAGPLLHSAQGEDGIVSPSSATATERFERIVGFLMRDLKTPGLSAIILKDQKVLWEKGFGYADLERKVRATPETPFGLASVTKPLGSIVFLRAQERGFLNLEESAIKYNAFMSVLPNGNDIKLKHLMSHTSRDPVGTTFRYDGNRYGGIGNAILKASGRSFYQQLQEDITGPLGMTRTVANPLDIELLDRFRADLASRGESLVVRRRNGSRYNLINLDQYAKPGARQTYQLVETMVNKALEKTTYGRDLYQNPVKHYVDAATQEAFNRFWLNQPEQDTYRLLAKPYELDSHNEIEKRKIIRARYPTLCNPAAGLVSTVRDLAKLDVALNAGGLISPESKALAWEPVRSPSGDVFPYGYGWFSQQYAGRKIVWHGGAWRGMSSMYLKLPEENYTFIFLSNSKVQSDAFDMGAGDALNSGFGLAFLRLFLFEPVFGETGPDIDWTSPPEDIVRRIDDVRDARLRKLYLKELEIMQGMYMYMMRSDVVSGLLNEVVPHYKKPFDDPYVGHAVIAELTEVRDDQRVSVDFTLDQKTRVRVYAIGEVTADGTFDYGWIVKKGSDEKVWSMGQDEWGHAGGATKNRLADVVIELPAGAYTLHYVTDDSHAYMTWNAQPPDHFFWGCRILLEE